MKNYQLLKHHACFLMILAIFLITACYIPPPNDDGGRNPGNTNPPVLDVQYGKGAYYSRQFIGRPTASGELYDPEKLTAGHQSLPFGTICRVTNLVNGRQIQVRINDRGPFVKGRIIDVSERGARELEMMAAGVVEVKVEVLKMGPGSTS